MRNFRKEESDQLCYSEIIVAPESRLRSDKVRDTVRPESMTYSEIMVVPPRKELPKAKGASVRSETAKKHKHAKKASFRSKKDRSVKINIGSGKVWRKFPERLKEKSGKEKSVKPKSASAEKRAESKADVTSKGAEFKPQGKVDTVEVANGAEPVEETAYYLDLLGEDEVIYDLMYATGHGPIHFWPPPGLSLSSSPLSGHTSSTDAHGAVAAGPGVNSVMSELQMRLQGASLNHGALRKTGINLVDGPNPPVEQQAPPDDEDDDEMYEDLNNVYQNA